MNLEELRNRYKPQILASAKANNIDSVKVFGSIAKGNSNEGSDIDFLVTLTPDSSGWDIGGFYSDVRELVGKDIDVVTENSIHPYIKKQILEEAISL